MRDGTRVSPIVYIHIVCGTKCAVRLLYSYAIRLISVRVRIASYFIHNMAEMLFWSDAAVVVPKRLLCNIFAGVCRLPWSIPSALCVPNWIIALIWSNSIVVDAKTRRKRFVLRNFCLKAGQRRLWMLRVRHVVYVRRCVTPKEASINIIYAELWKYQENDSIRNRTKLSAMCVTHAVRAPCCQWSESVSAGLRNYRF